MAFQTTAQEEFDSIVSKSQQADRADTSHPGDREDYTHDHDHEEIDEETEYTQRRIDETMRSPILTGGGGTMLHLPPREFDMGRTTGVKGVIADARSFEEARFGRSSSLRSKQPQRASQFIISREDEEGRSSASEDDDGFVERWRAQRRLELQQKGSDIRTRRTSPSVRTYGRFDEVDALGYLDAIEKVGRDTVVVVFVYDAECEVSHLVTEALAPLVPKYTTVHFVRVSYEDIEFDNAGVPAILAYRNQGDLFANLTYVIDQLPADAPVDSKTIESVLQKHQVLPAQA
ncbi:hypothetical protein OIDMADRAFT_25574 [Oidiodendron maius Zn]|uniref:Phosducin domain-containing protein n=1 Tax=Oidiodendron maius (strain Zn) TaxID=913774 RepID=A0A0C3HRR8_OIDMZ|nr:hypothetical protein OIDMADRAFT_25574 [Oidiodendron maius Zn]